MTPINSRRLFRKLLLLCALGVLLQHGLPQSSKAKLSPAPDDDGLVDPQDQAAVDAVNEHLEDLAEELADGEMTALEYEQWSVEHQALLDALNPVYPECARLEPPKPNTSAGYPECAVARDTSACDPFPCANTQPSGCNLSQMPFADVTNDYQVKVEKGVNPARNEEELVQMAWSILQENVDLVSWTSCMYYGEDETSFLGFDTSLAECLSDKIQGRNARAKVVFTTMAEAPTPTANAWGSSGTGGGSVYFPTDGNRWSATVSAYTAAADNSAEEFCLAARAARTLLHELVHTCPASKRFDDHPSGTDQSNSCSSSYLIGNGFSWALAARYPCLAATSCDDYAQDDYWGSDQ